MTYRILLAVFLGGGVGSVFRQLLSEWTQSITQAHFPLGILLVNIIGCFLIGYLTILLTTQLPISPIWRIGILIGVLGGFTTFSSFSMLTIRLFEVGLYGQAIWNVALSLSGCLLATVAGIWLAQRL